MIGPGDVPELAGYNVGVGVADEAGEQRQVVVLGEHSGGMPVYLVQNLAGELLVYGFIGFPVRGVEDRLGVGVVAQGPQGRVGEPVVISPLFFLGQPHQTQSIGRVVRGDLNPVLIVHRIPVALAAAVGDPRSAALLHKRVYGGGDTSGGHRIAKPPFHHFMDVGLAVGHDYQAIVSDLAFN